MDDDWGYPYDFGNLHFAKWSIFTLRRYSPWATRLIEEVFRVQHRQVILTSSQWRSNMIQQTQN